MILPVSAPQSGSKLRVAGTRRGRSAWVRCASSVKAYNSVRFDPLRDVQMGSARISQYACCYDEYTKWCSYAQVEKRV